MTTLAEMAARLGYVAKAGEHFQQAISAGPSHVYLLGAYSDFLLDQERFSEVITLLHDKTRVDTLLLRLALAERAAPNSKQLLAKHARPIARSLRGQPPSR